MRPPSTANRSVWPPNYVEVWGWRQRQLLELRKNPKLLRGAIEFYAEHPVEFINHWCDTYDPRNAANGRPVFMPFVMFDKQAEMVQFLRQMIQDEQSGLIEKARDMGATWVCVAFSVWLWRFWPGAAVGWGSRKELLVDRIGDPSSIFEKLRMTIRRLPPEFLPKGFKENDHCSSMKILNPETGGSITGEGGDNIGRGGRTLIYFKDESAHYERPEKIEAALADNTRVQIDISSVNGMGNVFHRRREGGVDWYPGIKTERGRVSVFVMDWSDHPEKDQTWYEERRRKAEDDGLLHLFAQEVERNYASSVEGVIIPAEWVMSAVDAHVKLGFEPTGPHIPALDVADGGGDKHALAIRQGALLKFGEDWGAGDVGQATRRALELVEGLGRVELQYDSIGVGAGVKSEANRLAEGGLAPKVAFVPWNAAHSVQDPDEHLEPGDSESPTNKDFFQNLKAQAWWELRRRFERTHKAVTEGHTYPPDSLISLASDLPRLPQIRKELSQPTMAKSASTLKLVVNKTPEGTRSPNIADAIVMAYWPVRDTSYTLDFL